MRDRTFAHTPGWVRCLIYYAAFRARPCFCSRLFARERLRLIPRITGMDRKRRGGFFLSRRHFYWRWRAYLCRYCILCRSFLRCCIQILLLLRIKLNSCCLRASCFCANTSRTFRCAFECDASTSPFHTLCYFRQSSTISALFLHGCLLSDLGTSGNRHGRHYWCGCVSYGKYSVVIEAGVLPRLCLPV